jgi:hypothetical protein
MNPTTCSGVMNPVTVRRLSTDREQHYNQGIRLYREEKLPAAIHEWRAVLQYDPNHEGAKKNIQTAERLLKGLQERQQKQGR